MSSFQCITTLHKTSKPLGTTLENLNYQLLTVSINYDLGRESFYFIISLLYLPVAALPPPPKKRKEKKVLSILVF